MTDFRRNWEVWALAGLLLVHIVLGVYWSVTIPIFEAHDEDGHYFFVRYLATQHRLPPPGEDSSSNNDEMHQPPLYYILAAVPVSFVNLPDEFIPHYNPYIDQPDAQGGRNKVIHDPVLESWPYRGDVLAIHLARWVSVLLGSLALVFTYLAARTLCPSEPWVRWGAVLVLAFWPQFRFTTAVINNDIMVTVSAAAVTWLLLRMVVAGRVRAVDLLALGGATGAALLSKNNGLALAPVVLGVLCLRAGRAGLRHRWRALAWTGAGSVVAIVSVGWWYGRNLRSGAPLFGARGRITSVGWFLAPVLGQRRVQFDLVLPAVRQGLISLWGAFGWNNVSLPSATYYAAAAWCCLVAIGLVLWLYRRPARRQVVGSVVLLLVGVCMFALPMYIYISQSRFELPGRYLLPAVPALSVLFGVGWCAILPRSWREAGWAVLVGGLLLLALLTPSLWIRCAYATALQVNDADLAEYTHVRATFGGFAELVGYRIQNPLVAPGDSLRVSLAWKVLAEAPEDYTLRLKAFDQDDTLGEVWRYPGGGALATTTWRPGQLFVEEVAIPIVSDKANGRQAWLEVRCHGPGEAEVRDGEGRSIGNALCIGDIKVRGQEQAAALSGEGAQFGAAISLVGARADVQTSRALCRVDAGLTWAALAWPEGDYTVSVQLRDAQQDIMAQVDEQPQEGAYPTHLWEPGERVHDWYTLFLPPGLADGRYTVYVCLYDAANGERQQAYDAQGRALPNNEVPLLTMAMRGGEAAEVLPCGSWVDVATEHVGGSTGDLAWQGQPEELIATALANTDRMLAAD